jgi:hypothetical protein
VKESWYKDIRINNAAKMLTSALIDGLVYFLEFAKIGKHTFASQKKATFSNAFIFPFRAFQ